MPELIAQTDMDAQSIHRLREETSKLCLFMARNTDKYFLAEYELAPPDYLSKTTRG